MIIKKPFDQEEVRLAATALCEKWGLSRKAEWKQFELEQQVALQTTQIVQIRDLTVFALARLAESRDPETGEHLVRMRAYSQILAEELARGGPYATQVDRQFLDDLYRSSPLHDIGKVGIPDSVLLKPGRLTPDEFEIMKQHTRIGAETLADATRQTPAGSFLQMAIDIAHFHHEHFNGGGYPQGLQGAQIPLAARIVAVADVFDALTSKRIYKQAIEPQVARAMIIEQSGRHFDPAVVDAFVARYAEFLDVLCAYTESCPDICRKLTSPPGKNGVPIASAAIPATPAISGH
jgi:putative two-component system response regulator